MIHRPLLLISETAQTDMIIAASRAHPYETGGIFVGVHANGQPWATTAIEIVSVDQGHRHYKIPGGSTQPMVHKARKVDHRVGYLGDWHSHPCDVGPSPIDFASLRLVSNRHPADPKPTLVVVRNTALGYVLNACRIVANTPRTCEVTLTGALPPPDALSQ